MKILISDFDHTFFDDNYLKNIELVNKFVSEGNMFIIATGRSINNLNIDIIDYKISYSYLICSDGASIYDNKHNNIYTCNIDANLINPICNLLESDSNITLTLIENDNFVSGTVANSIAGKFIDKVKCESLVKKLNKLFPTINSYLSDNYINIRNKKVSKYEGIKFLIDNYNLDSEKIYTIGDSINDKEMCKNFSSFSFYNADESVKIVSNTILENFEEAINLLMKK